MDVRVSWAELDTLRASVDLKVGYAEFDAKKPALDVRVGFVEFDAGIPVVVVPPTRPPVSGGGTLTGGHGWPSSRYYNAATRKYDIPVFNVAEEEEELVILQLLMQIAQDEIL